MQISASSVHDAKLLENSDPDGGDGGVVGEKRRSSFHSSAPGRKAGKEVIEIGARSLRAFVGRRV